MPTLNVTDSQFRSSLQNIQNRYIRIELLNYQYQTVDELSGICTSGSFTIDANSDVRRTGSIVMVVTDGSFEVASGGKIWLDKFAKIHVGTMNISTGEIDYVNIGMYIIDSPSYNYDPSTNTLTISLLDLMAKLTGIRNGYLPGIPVILSAGENIRQAIIDTLALGGFTKYVVEEAPAPGTIPNDLEFEQGATVYDLLVGLRDIYPDYEMYFDVDGVFYYKPIPDGNDDPVLVDDSLFDNIVTAENLTVDFQNVKNSIEVYGRTHDPEHFSDNTTVSGNTITLSIADVSAYTDGMIYGFTLTDNPGYTSPSIRINSLSSLPLLMDDGKTGAKIEAEEGEIYYCIQYKSDNNGYWRWLGHLQSYGFAEDTNPDSPFYVEGTVGRIRLPLFDNEYANCYTDDLAQQRAEYELWLHTNMNNTVTLTCVPTYWLDVNILTQYTLRSNNVTAKYLIKNITFGLAPTDVMTLTMMKFYPEREIEQEYTYLQYIEGTGTQYIDTGIKPNQNSRVMCSFELTSEYTSVRGIFGVRDTSSGTAPNQFGFWNSGTNTFRTDYFGSQQNMEISPLLARYEVNKNGATTTINDVEVTNTAATGTCTQPIYLFCMNDAGAANYFSNVRIYYFYHYDENGSLDHQFLPAIQNSTNKVGLYDYITDTFYENAGTDSFVSGPEADD